MLENKPVRFIVIRNPLVPDNRLHLEREWQQAHSLYDYIGDLQGSYAISHNGAIVEQHQLAEHTPQAGDVVVICPIMHGGGNGKNILRLVAVVALTAFTYGGGLAALTGLQAGSAALIATQAAVAIGGTLLINAVLPYDINADDGGDASNRDINYGIDGAKNSSEDNIPFPLVYGRHRVAGNIIGNYTEQEGQIQYLNMLICAGEGVIAGIDVDSILINDQSIDQLAYKPEVRVYHGSDHQNIPSKFLRQSTPVDITLNNELTDPAIWTEYTTSVEKEVEGMIALFSAQIVKIDKKGNDVEHTVKIELQYAPEGTEEWRSFVTGVREEDAANGYLFKWDDETGDRYDPAGQTVTKVAKGTQAIDYTKANFYNVDTNRYANYYLSDGEDWIAQSDEFTTDAYWNAYYSNRASSETGLAGGDFFAQPDGPLPDDIAIYEYGELQVGGVTVGTYHDFHLVNTIKGGWNNHGLSGGTRTGEVIHLTGDTSSTNLRFTYESPRLKLGRYRVRARRIDTPSEENNIQDDVFFNEITELVMSKVAYNYTALLQLRIRVSDQINSIPTVTYEHLGQVIRVWEDESKTWHPSVVNDQSLAISNTVWVTPKAAEIADYSDILPFTQADKEEIANDYGAPFPMPKAFDVPAHLLEIPSPSMYYLSFYQHDNPAWIALDILTSKRYGAGLPPARMDFYAFKAWADHCEENNLSFRGVFSDRSNVWDVLSTIFKVGRAIPIRMGTRYSVSVEKPKTAVMRFGQDNIIKDSFSSSWMSFDDRANELELTYYDEALDYRQRTIKVYDQAALDNGSKSVNSAASIKGIVTEERAIREATFMLNFNKLIQMVEFEAPIEALACTIGDVIQVQHSMMNWGHAGKIAATSDLGSGNTQIILDQPFVFESGQDWQFTTSTGVVSRGSFTIEAMFGNYVTLTGFDNSEQAKRIMVNGLDIGIMDTFVDDIGNHGLVLQHTNGVSIGDTVELFDTDVISSVSLTPSVYDAETNTITVTGLPALPERYDGFLIGFENFEARLFTVRAIGLTDSSMTRKISALEYDERALSDTDTDFVIEDIVVERALAPVTGLEIYDKPYIEGFEQKVRVSIHWVHTDPRYRNAAINISINGEGDRYLGQHSGHVSFVCDPGRVVTIHITPFDQMGKQGATLTTKHVTVGGAANPYFPINVYISNISGGAKINWTITDRYLKGHEVFAIETGGLVNGTDIDSLDASTITDEDVELYGELLGLTDQNFFLHLLDTDVSDATAHYYWVRSVDGKAQESVFVYAGKSTPYTSVSYNTVTVYQFAVDQPATPTGGTYLDPNPNEAEWTLEVPAYDENAPSGTKLWQSSRVFANLESKTQAEWSVPSYISIPTENAFTWTAYADDLVGTNFSFTKLDTTRYVGKAYNQTEATPSSDYSLYEWVLLLIDPADISDLTESALADIFNLTQTTVEREFERTEMYGPEGINAGLIENETRIITETEARILLESTLYAKMDTDIGAILQQVSSATADLESAWTTLETQLLAQYEDANSYIIQQQVALAKTNLSLVQSEETLRAEFGGNFAEINEIKTALATAEGTYAAQWGVTTNVNGLQGGVGFYNNGTTTQFVVDADIFAVRDAGSTEVVFSVVDGQTVIKDAFIREAYIQNLIADHISANTIEANTIAVGATLTSVDIRGNGTAGFGAGGPYNGYHTFISANGLIQTNNIVATGGTFSNILIDGTCEIDELVISGSTYAVPKFHENTSALTLGAGSFTVFDKDIDMGQVGTKVQFRINADIEGGNVEFTPSNDSASATIQILVNDSVVMSIPRSRINEMGQGCCQQNDGDCISYCDVIEGSSFSSQWEDTVILPVGSLSNGINNIKIVFNYYGTWSTPSITNRKFEMQMIEEI